MTHPVAAAQTGVKSADSLPISPVNSYTEWDTLQEVVVGSLAGAVVPTWQESMAETMPRSSWDFFKQSGGQPFPEKLVAAADLELDQLSTVLEDYGVTVRRPERPAHGSEYSTPEWRSTGLYSGMPRDHLIVFGDTVVEAPMSWRCRRHEADAFRPLLKDLSRRGGRWVAAPPPQLTDDLFAAGTDDGTHKWAVSELEPVFDAADFMRFGDDIVVQRSHVTNDFGIDWVRRLLGPQTRVHTIDVNDPHAMHIDATLVPLAPGILLVNPERFVYSDLFDGWDIIEAPKPTLPDDWPMYFCSSWVSMNVLSIDKQTVVVERHEKPLIDALTKRGFTCVEVDFRHVYTFGGSFHCVTLDVLRDGGPGTYLQVDADRESGTSFA